VPPPPPPRSVRTVNSRSAPGDVDHALLNSVADELPAKCENAITGASSSDRFVTGQVLRAAKTAFFQPLRPDQITMDELIHDVNCHAVVDL